MVCFILGSNTCFVAGLGNWEGTFGIILDWGEIFEKMKNCFFSSSAQNRRISFHSSCILHNKDIHRMHLIHTRRSHILHIRRLSRDRSRRNNHRSTEKNKNNW